MSGPPDAPTFFVDRDLGPRFASKLATDSRYNVEYHDTHFPDPKTDDSEWLTLIAAKSWVGVTHDGRLRADHRPIVAMHGSRVLIVVGRRTIEEQAENFIVTYPRILRFVSKRPGPYTAKLYHPTPRELKLKLKPKGRVELWGNWP
jgi:hypothetical protein